MLANCPTVPILSGQYRFKGLCPESRLYPYTLLGTNVPRSACSSIHRAQWQKLLNYNGRGNVSSARANAALGAIINVTRMYINTLRAGNSFFRCAVIEIKVVNHAYKAYS